MKVKITLIEQVAVDDDNDIEINNDVTFTTSADDPNVNIYVCNGDTGEEVEINVLKSEMKKVLYVLNLFRDSADNVTFPANESDLDSALVDEPDDTVEVKDEAIVGEMD